MEERFYAGIGSRKTPAPILSQMTLLGASLSALGYSLRSGAAEGADTAFELGANAAANPPHKEIFLPWPNFEGNKSLYDSPSDEAYELASRYYDQLHNDRANAWANAGPGVRSLMARNCHQILGQDLKRPVEFVLYWADHAYGKKICRGGTAMGLTIADAYNIPFYIVGSGYCNSFLDTLNITV